MSELENVIREIAEPFVASMDLEIWGIEISQFHKMVIRIYVDAPTPDCHGLSEAENSAVSLEMPVDSHVQEDSEMQGELKDEAHALSVGVDQCARISRHIGLILEVEDIITEAYVLEVSSPGLSRQFFKLSQLHSYVGHNMEVVLREGHEAWDNRRKFTGILAKVTDESICLNLHNLDKPKTTKCIKKNINDDADNAAQVVIFDWEEIRIIKRVHSFDTASVVAKKKKKN